MLSTDPGRQGMPIGGGNFNRLLISNLSSDEASSCRPDEHVLPIASFQLVNDETNSFRLRREAVGQLCSHRHGQLICGREFGLEEGELLGQLIRIFPDRKWPAAGAAHA